MKIENKKTKIMMLLLLLVVVLLLVVYFVFIKKSNDSQNKPIKISNFEKVDVNNTLGLMNLDGNDASIDYENLENKLINALKNGASVYLNKCNSCVEMDYENVRDLKCTKKNLSSDSIKLLINKLQSSRQVEILPNGVYCSSYNYYVGDILMVSEGEDTSILSVSLNNNFYAFHFNDDVIEFLDNLK